MIVKSNWKAMAICWKFFHQFRTWKWLKENDGNLLEILSPIFFNHENDRRTDENRWKFNGNFYITSINARKHQRNWLMKIEGNLMEIIHRFNKCRKTSTNLTDENRWKFDGNFYITAINEENINELDRTMTDENRWKFDGNFYITSINAGKHQRTWPHNDWWKSMENFTSFQ